MLEVAAGGGYRVSPCVLRRRLRLCGPIHPTSFEIVPGFCNLFALGLKLFGISILPIRMLMAGLHAVCALLLYGLTRRVAAWPFALLPFAIVAALDHWPVEPEPHPSWPALVLCLLTME